MDPSIRMSVNIAVPNVLDRRPYKTTVGFAVMSKHILPYTCQDYIYLYPVKI